MAINNRFSYTASYDGGSSGIDFYCNPSVFYEAERNFYQAIDYINDLRETMIKMKQNADILNSENYDNFMNTWNITSNVVYSLQDLQKKLKTYKERMCEFDSTFKTALSWYYHYAGDFTDKVLYDYDMDSIDRIYQIEKEMGTISSNMDSIVDLIKKYESLIKGSKSVQQVIQDISSAGGPSLVDVFPLCLYDTTCLERIDFEILRDALNYLGIEEDSKITRDEYIENVNSGKYLTILLKNTSYTDGVLDNIKTVIYSMGINDCGGGVYEDLLPCLLDIDERFDEIKNLLGDEAAWNVSMFRNDLNNNIWGYELLQNMYGVYDEDVLATMRSDFAYYAIYLGYVYDEDNHQLLNKAGKVVFPAIDDNNKINMEECKQFLNSLELNYYEKVFSKYGLDFNSLKDELAAYMVDVVNCNSASQDATEYRENIVEIIFKAINKDNDAWTMFKGFENGNLTDAYKLLINEGSAVKLFDRTVLSTEAVANSFFNMTMFDLNSEQSYYKSEINSLKEMYKQLENQNIYLELSKLFADEDTMAEYIDKDLIVPITYMNGTTGQYKDTQYDEYLNVMTDEEKSEFKYLYLEYGKVKAEEYFAIKEEEWNSRIGLEKAYNWVNNFLTVDGKYRNLSDMTSEELTAELENLGIDDNFINALVTAGKGLTEGVEGFFEGLANNIVGDGIKSANDFERMYIQMMLASTAVLGHTYNISSSIGNMLPPMVISTITTIATKNPELGRNIATILMGVSAAGNTFESSLQEGQNYWQSRFYGALTGVSEATLERFLGGIPGFSALDDIPGLKGFATKILSEGLEEGTQTIVDSYLRSACFGETVDINWDEVLLSGAYGMITAGIMNGGVIVYKGTHIALNLNNKAQLIKMFEVIDAAEKIGEKIDYKLINNPDYVSYLEGVIKSGKPGTFVVGGLKNENDVNLVTNNDSKILETTVESVKTEVSNLNYEKTSAPQYVYNYLASNFRKFLYKDTNSVDGLNEQIMQNGLYHFTGNPDVIINSGYVKASSKSKSYGNQKSFFFNGVPDFGAFAMNLKPELISVKTQAVKIVPTAEMLNSSKFKLRYFDDLAITHDGALGLEGCKVEKCYFGLVAENGKLEYKQISEELYNNYENTNMGKVLADYISNQQNINSIRTNFLTEIANRNKGNIEVEQIWNGKNNTHVVDSVHGMQLNKEDFGGIYKTKIESGFYTSQQVDDVLNNINNKGYVSSEAGEYFSSLFNETDYDIYVKTINSFDLNSIMSEGVRCLGTSTSGYNSAPTDISQIKLGNTITKVDGTYDLVSTLKNAFGISQGGNPIDGTLILKVPKGTNINDMLYYNESSKTYNIKSEYIDCFSSVDQNGVVSEPIFNDVGVEKLDNNSQITESNRLNIGIQFFGGVDSNNNIYYNQILNSVSNIDSYVNVLNDCMKSIDNIFGFGTAIKQLYDYLYSGNEMVITNSNFRDIVINMKRDELLNCYKVLVNEYNSQVSNSKTETNTIKNEIFANMPADLDDLSKCRYLYMELNKRVSYEQGYFSLKNDLDAKSAYYNQFVSFDTLVGNKVICNGWSQLYRELLIDAGIDGKMVSVCGKNQMGAHKWVEINFGDYIIRADATDAFNHSVDISASKSGSVTNGFIAISSDYSGINLNYRLDDGSGKTYFEQLQIDDQWLRNIDSSLGYADSSTGKYFNEVVNDLSKDFYKPNLVEKIFGVKDEKLLAAKHKYYMNLEIPSNMNAYDVYPYLNQTKYALFGKGNNDISLSLWYRPSSNSTIPVGAVTICDSSGMPGNLIVKIIDDELGIMEYKFNNLHEYVNFRNSMGYYMI